MTTAAEGTGASRDARSGRRHALLAHTADAGLVAVAADLPALFEEAAAAFSALTAELGPAGVPLARETVELEAADLPGLAFAWLNDLVALGELHHAAVAAAAIEAIEAPPGAPPDRRWRLSGSVGLQPYAHGGARLLRHVKSATYHRLEVRRHGRRWTMTAYLDV